MSRIANPYRYAFTEHYPSVPCVFKMHFGTRYFIWKAKALHQGVNQLAVEFDRKLRHGVKDDDIFRPVIKYIVSGRIGLMRIEMIKQTDDPTDMLLTEFKELQAAKNDPKCLNKIFEPYVAAWIPVEAKQALEAAIANSKKKVVRKPKPKTANAKKKATKKSPAKNAKVRSARRSGR